MLVCQGLIMLGLWLMAGSDPSRSLGTIAVFAVLVGFSSATQDIAIDAWRIEAAEVSKQGAMAAAYQWGYRVAIIVAGAVPLLLAEAYGWNFSYAVMAALMTVGVLAVLAAPREERHAIRPIQTGDIQPAPAREALEWVARLAILAAGALVLGSGLAANAGVLAARARRCGRDRRTRRRAVGLGVGRARVGPSGRRGGGVRRDRACRAAASRRAHAARRLSLLGARRSAARFLRALPLRRGADSGADLPLPHPGLRAEHHESVLSRPRLHAWSRSPRSGRSSASA